ncbi:MAG: hypothetical protein Hyperionvirus24_11 [Hyperionvirus sp.]|uniref:Uncharacterized protein n=1 Tax=Hyperionvirus sp. TaxID=2487770 RepID=A0A3G5AG75_9VIRU|nr:MAG: hypothetical protein Hyperionvirus24_11 [Hyperionvirus sp.]
MASAEGKFVFEDKDENPVPKLTGITVGRVLGLIDRLSKATFVVSALTDAELRCLMHEVASLLPYHRGIIEQLLIQRINAEPKCYAIWCRLKGSEDGTTVAFFAKHFCARECVELKDNPALMESERNKASSYARAYALGERLYSAFEIAKSSYKTDSKGAPPEMIKLLNESCLAGNPIAHKELIVHVAGCFDDTELGMGLDLFGKRLLLGPGFSGMDMNNLITNMYFGNFVSQINTLRMDYTLNILKCAGNCYIGVEHLIQSKQLDGSYYERTTWHGSDYNQSVWWRLTEANDHKTFLSLTLEKILEDFGKAGQKIISDYFMGVNNNVLTAQILFFLATTSVKSSYTYFIEDEKEALTMLQKSIELRNESALKYLTESSPFLVRQIRLIEAYHALGKSGL